MEYIWIFIILPFVFLGIWINYKKFNPKSRGSIKNNLHNMLNRYSNGEKIGIYNNEYHSKKDNRLYYILIFSPFILFLFFVAVISKSFHVTLFSILIIIITILCYYFCNKYINRRRINQCILEGKQLTIHFSYENSKPIIFELNEFEIKYNALYYGAHYYGKTSYIIPAYYTYFIYLTGLKTYKFKFYRSSGFDNTIAFILFINLVKEGEENQILYLSDDEIEIRLKNMHKKKKSVFKSL